MSDAIGTTLMENEQVVQALAKFYVVTPVAGLAANAPWLLEDKLVELGANYSKAAEPWSSHVVVDRNVYTGQNPQSSEELAKRIVSDLG